MASRLNSDSSNGLQLISDSSGEIQIQSSGTTICTINSSGLSMQSGVLAPTGPAFRAYMSSSQSISNGTWTKVQFDTENFDLTNDYDTSNYRFIPSVEGYYHMNGLVRSVTTSQTHFIIAFYKNGNTYSTGLQNRDTTSSSNQYSISDLVYMNGTTDYIELYTYIAGTSPTLEYNATTNTSTFSAFLARAA